MKCIYCKNPAGLFKIHHEDCYNKVQTLLQKMEQIVNQYKQGSISAEEAKSKLISLASSDRLYLNYLEYEIFDLTTIRTNEIVIYIEEVISISESKNRCKMVRTGYQQEKKLTWNETNQAIGDYAKIVFTDKCVYILLDASTMMYPYDEIMNLGSGERLGYGYFDVKTSSPYPHRFSIKPYSNREQIIWLFLKCLMGY